MTNYILSLSELKYLLALENYCEKETGLVKLTLISQEMNVAKASVSNAINRLLEKGYIERYKKHITITDYGKNLLDQYHEIIDFVSRHLEINCQISAQNAYEDAVKIASVLSDECRKNLANLLALKRVSCEKE